CISCGKCIQVCPPKVVSKDSENNIIIDYSGCISCFCCHEFCPEHAVRIKKNTIRKIFEYKRV
ncbi:MAG: 4Fe-4S dicluster domain-containing protein, partial [Clostridiaceae bacterium]|nr:4Fe-4S dicluster domain-containing protein [Clostridiaceae bacterium]